MSERLLVKPSRASRIIRLGRKVKRLLDDGGNCQASSEIYCPSERLGSHSVEVSGFLPPCEELETVFAGVDEFPYVDLYVHGSWADDTRTAFSDLDDLVIIDRDEIGDERQLRRLEAWLNRVDMRFCRIDPLQHHGHWIIYRDQLNDYDESYMPLVVLEGAVRVQGRARVIGTIDGPRTLVGLHRNVRVTLANIERLFDRYQSAAINLYQMKRLVGSILLVPAYAFQIKGHRISKGEALRASRKIYSEEANRAIEVCSMIREGWGRALGGTRYALFTVMSHILTEPHIYRRLASRLAPRFPTHLFAHLNASWVNTFSDETVQYINDS